MGTYLKALCAGILMGMMPVMVFAGETLAVGVSSAVKNTFFHQLNISADSIPRPVQDDKNKDSKKSPSQEKEPKHDPKAREIDPKRPDIKEVPKSRPKLRPGIVPDKIRRPPIKIGKPMHILHNRLL